MQTSVTLASRQAFRTGFALAFCSNSGMTPKESMIQRLKLLCSTHGVEMVAAKAHVSADNLRQIIAGTKLESGAPRGVGPTLQRKLEAHYPGWADRTPGEAPPPSAGNRFEDRHQISESDWGTLQAVKTILTERELQDIRERHAKIVQHVLDRLDRLSNGSK